VILKAIQSNLVGIYLMLDLFAFDQEIHFTIVSKYAHRCATLYTHGCAVFMAFPVCTGSHITFHIQYFSGAFIVDEVGIGQFFLRLDRFGLAAIKGVGEVAVEAILKARSEGGKDLSIEHGWKHGFPEYAQS